MTAFCLGIAALIALNALMLLPALRTARPTGQADATSLGLLKHAWTGLDTELAEGVLGPAQYSAAREELQRRALQEAPSGEPAAIQAGSPRRTGLMLSIGIPLIALGLYGGLGNLAALNPPPPAATEDANAPVRAMVEMLAQRLDSEPGLAQDVSAWTMLARAYAAMQRFPEADRAYARAIALTPNDPQLLADRADVLAMLQGGRTAGEPQRLIERALAIDPGNLKARALADNAAAERQAIAPSAAAERQAAAPSAVVGAQVTGRATLAPALASRVLPGDTVFITARAIEGPRMPLAVLRRTARELPLDFRLDDSMAMSPEATLSMSARVVVSVRISRSGNAMAQSGDLFGQASADTTDGRPVAVVIDQIQP